jgi:hypothetical protein
MRRCRRLFALLTVMLFAFSIVGNGFMFGDMAAKMSMTASMNMSAQGGSMDCDKNTKCDHDQGIPMSCFVHCASTVAVLSDPVRLPVIAFTRIVVATAVSVPASRHRPPDPYPPKSVAVI